MAPSADYDSFDRRGLNQLLGVAMDPEACRGPEALAAAAADLIGACLEAPLPSGSPDADALHEVLYPLARQLGLAGRPTLGGLIADPDCPLCVLTTIKEYGKRLAGVSRNGALHAAGVGLYFAAIAAALLHRDARITSYSYSRLATSFDHLAGEDWTPAVLTELFAKAARAAADRGADRAAGTRPEQG